MPPATATLSGVVVSAGLMQKTVKVRIVEQVWDKHIRKHFTRPTHHLVHDPASSLVAGDIITFSPGYRTSKRVHHVVTSILAPFEKPIESRPAVWSAEQRDRFREEKRIAKLQRRSLRDGLLGEAKDEMVGGQGTKMRPAEDRARISERVGAFREKGLMNEAAVKGSEGEAGNVDEDIRRGRTGR